MTDPSSSPVPSQTLASFLKPITEKKNRIRIAQVLLAVIATDRLIRFILW